MIATMARKASASRSDISHMARTHSNFPIVGKLNLVSPLAPDAIPRRGMLRCARCSLAVTRPMMPRPSSGYFASSATTSRKN